jgi:hypothetical protein
MVETRLLGGMVETALGEDVDSRLDQLRRTLRSYQQRYGDVATADVVNANSALTTRERRLRHLSEEKQRLEAQIVSVRAEMRRIEEWVEFCLEDAIEQARRNHGEGWSPIPVLGYRVWAIGPDGFHGVKMRWEVPGLAARCLRDAGEDEIPHTDGRCGRLGCGVYVSKAVTPLYEEFDVRGLGDVALGLIALTGKVVEHERGYRGAKARVVALGASYGRHLLLTDDPEEINEVFALPDLITQEPMVLNVERRLRAMERFVVAAARKEQQWI